MRRLVLDREIVRLYRTDPARSVAQTWKLRFARSIDSMCAFAICSSFGHRHGAIEHHTMPDEGRHPPHLFSSHAASSHGTESMGIPQTDSFVPINPLVETRASRQS